VEPTDERPIDRLIEYMASGDQEIAARTIDLEAEMDDSDGDSDNDNDNEGESDDEVDDVWEGWDEQ
jgi:hypothetical protein